MVVDNWAVTLDMFNLDARLWSKLLEHIGNVFAIGIVICLVYLTFLLCFFFMGKLVVTSALTGFVQIEWHQRAAGFLCVPRSLGWSFVNTVCWYIGTSLFVLPMVKGCISPWLVASYRYGWKAAAYDPVDEHLVWRFPKMRLSPNHLKGRSPNHIEAAPWLSIETTMVIWFGGPPVT